MTDHNREEREAVIESAWAMTPDEIAQHPYAAMDKMRWLARELRSVFEQAHTPTSDERGWSAADRRGALAEAQSRFTLSPDADGKTRRWADGCVNGFLLGAEWWKSTHPASPVPQAEPTAAEGIGQPTNHEGAR